MTAHGVLLESLLHTFLPSMTQVQWPWLPGLPLVLGLGAARHGLAEVCKGHRSPVCQRYSCTAALVHGAQLAPPASLGVWAALLLKKCEPHPEKSGDWPKSQEIFIFFPKYTLCSF